MDESVEYKLRVARRNIDDLFTQVQDIKNGLIYVAVVLMGFILFYFYKNRCKKEPYFEMTGSTGFKYNVDDLKFSTPDDRAIAIRSIVEMFQRDGVEYTPEQIGRLESSFMIFLLEPEDELELEIFKKSVPILIDEDYTTAKEYIKSAEKNKMTFKSPFERELVYNLLVRYFNIMKTPIQIPLERWTDSLLILTFKTRKLPQLSNF